MAIMMGYGGFGGFGGFSWIGMILNLVLVVAVIIGVVLLVIWLVRRMGRNSNQIYSTPSGVQSPKDIAQARYARGEISREEYQQIIADLNH
jgi:putative membrane protein